MKLKNILILLGVLGILLIVAIFSPNPFKGTRKTTIIGENLFPQIDSTSLAKIELIGGRGGNVVLEKQYDNWVVATSDSYPADPQAITLVLEKLQEAKLGDVVSRNPEKLNIFEADSSGIETKLYDKDNNELAHFFIGKSGPDYSSSYLRMDGSDEVILVSDYSRYVFDKENKNWRDKAIVKLNRDDVTGLTLKEKGKKKLVFKKNDEGNWDITEPIQAPAKTTAVNNMLSVLSNLLTYDWAEPKDLHEYGLDKPEFIINAELAIGTAYTILVGDTNEKNQSYVKKEGNDTIFLVYSSRFNNFKKDISEFQEEEKKEKKEEE